MQAATANDDLPAAWDAPLPGCRHPTSAPPSPCVAWLQVARRAKSGNGGYLGVTFEAVHPSELGLVTPWLSTEEYADRQCRLEVGWRRRTRLLPCQQQRLQSCWRAGAAPNTRLRPAACRRPSLPCAQLYDFRFGRGFYGVQEVARKLRQLGEVFLISSQVPAQPKPVDGLTEPGEAAALPSPVPGRRRGLPRGAPRRIEPTAPHTATRMVLGWAAGGTEALLAPADAPPPAPQTPGRWTPRT